MAHPFARELFKQRHEGLSGVVALVMMAIHPLQVLQQQIGRARHIE
jgi:hypothetical protein